MDHSSVRDFGGLRAIVDTRAQVIAIEVLPESAWEEADAIDAPIAPTLREFASSDSLVSISVLAEKTKRFDDGLFASVQLAAQRGAGRFRGKLPLIGDLLTSLAGEPVDSTIAVLLAAARLGGSPVTLDADEEPQLSDAIRRFLTDSTLSKPLGFYTWSPELRSIFQQDRMLQSELHPGSGLLAILRILRADERLRGGYADCLDLAARMTAPSTDRSIDLHALLQSSDGRPQSKAVRFFPPSRSLETDLLMRLSGGRSVPQGFNLIDELGEAIRRGELSLAPGPDSGWYDHQLWALEGCVTPEMQREAAHLRTGPGYRQQLFDVFRGAVALTREVHVKELDIPVLSLPLEVPEPTLRLAPELRVEPLASYCLRRALSYRFVRQVLERAFGAPALDGLQRCTIDGPVDRNLADDLADMERLLIGAYAVVCADLGMEPDDEVRSGPHDLDRSADFFQSWRREMSRDPDLGGDTRTMVPLFHDPQNGKTKCLLLLGWSSRPVNISYATPPGVEIVTRDGRPASARIEFESATDRLPYPVAVEAYASRILDRSEFRAHCDRHLTRDAIVRNLP